jgi:hypothetical protein
MGNISMRCGNAKGARNTQKHRSFKSGVHVWQSTEVMDVSHSIKECGTLPSLKREKQNGNVATSLVQKTCMTKMITAR